jgi:hypothetical protein
MFGKWYQIYVKEYNSGEPITPSAAKRMDEHLNRYGAMLNVPERNSNPISNCGEYEIGVLQESALEFVKFILTDHYGVKIERVVENGQL